MAFNINDFQQSIAEFDVVLTNKFDATITLPPILQTMASNNNAFPYQTTWNNLTPFRIASCSTPGVAFINHETTKLGVGPRIKQPYNAAFTPIRMALIADSQGIIEKTFNIWMNMSYQFGFDNNGFSTFKANYRSQLLSPLIQINKYDRQGSIVSTYNVVGALPTVFSNQKLDWSMRNPLSFLNVTFEYVSYTIV